MPPHRTTRRSIITAIVRAVGTIMVGGGGAYAARATPRENLVAFLQRLGIGDLDLTRERGIGRDIALDGRGARLVAHLRGRGDVAMSTAAIMALTRGDG